MTKLRAYGELVMFSHTLFSVPFGIIAMLLAAGGLPAMRPLVWILIALISARTAANALNRLVDREIDAANPRTAGRHLPQRLVSVPEVVILIAVCLVLLVLSACMLNPICVILLPFAMFVFFVYSFTKRFTWACHLILGFACGCAPAGAWMAIRPEFSPVPLILWAVVTFWVAGFDIIYGTQDVEFDRSHGLFSMPSVFGIRNALMISSAFHSIAMLLLISVLFFSQLGWFYMVGLCITAALLFYEHRMISPENLKKVTIASYSINQIVSVAILIFTAADILIKR